MKNKIWWGINVSLLALAVFFAFSEHGNAQKKDVWEYKVQRINMNITDNPEFYLNKTGQDGWELVTVNYLPNDISPVMVFKRRK